MLRNWKLVLLGILASAAPASAAVFEPPAFSPPDWISGSLSSDLVVGFPLSTGVYQSVFPGLHLQFDFQPGPWGLEAGYAFHSLAPFLFNHGSDQWSGPYLWGTTDSLDPDWPFYQTKHIVSTGLVYTWRHGNLDLKTALGLMGQFTLVSEAAQYYPEFHQRFAASQSGVETFLGNYWKFGFDFLALSPISVGADFVFEIPDWGPFLSEVQDRFWDYANHNAHIELRLGVKL